MTNQEIVIAYEAGLHHFICSDGYGENHINHKLLDEWLTSQSDEVLIYTREKFKKHGILWYASMIDHILLNRKGAKLTDLYNQLN